MNKNIFLLSDNVIHWNIVPAASRKNVNKEFWGEISTIRFLEIVKDYFRQSGKSVDWSVLESGLLNNNFEKISPDDNSVNHAFVTWRQFNDGKNKSWRVQEIVHVGQSNKFDEAQLKIDPIQDADLVVFQDWGMDIRHLKLPDFSNMLSSKWLIFRGFSPLFEGSLWEELQKRIGSKSVLIIRADDLRKLNTSISKGLSWEQTVQDIINEIYFKKNIKLHPLRTFEYLIISFGSTGSLLIHNSQNQKEIAPEVKLFFDSMGNEGYWERAHPGYLPGDLELLVSLLAKEILFSENENEILFDSAIRSHLLARRAISLAGANIKEGSLPLQVIKPELDKIYGSEKTHEFTPVQLDFSLFEVHCKDMYEKLKTSRDWSLLGMTKWDFYSLARKIALYGPMKALQSWNIPIAKYNFLLTVDRKEIEFLHHLKSLITEYLLGKNSQPLSIAVFGSPGSGKSFSIKQLAKALDLPDQEIKDITFNLSQFNEDNPSDLYQAFHAVRDISLSGKTPLVFWDEFDSKNLAWLRYFLAPMQDGEFQEGQLTHNIGKSIFVFAGGTCSCMEEFEIKVQTAISEKGPDFLSRIKGFINVMGPNPVLPHQHQEKECNSNDDEISYLNLAKNTDPEYIIRRAILINSLLLIGYKHLFDNGVLQIDDGVLNALLLVPKYKHGTRSMETIFKTSQLFGKQKYHRSDLPPESQMNLHVDGQQFYELISQSPKYYEGGEAFYHLVNDITLDENIVEKMAAGIHSIYSLVFSIDKGRNPLSITKEEFQATFENMKRLPDDMPLDEVSQNYHNARKIPEKLAAVGYMIIPLDAKIKPDQMDENEFEKLSRLEHIRWVRHHIDAGWTYAPIKNKPQKQHDALVAWDEGERINADLVYGKCYTQKMGLSEGEILSEQYKNLDRVITLAIPWILENVGFKIIKQNE